MTHFSNARWTLPGPSSLYLIVWWDDAAARDIRRRVPLTSVMAQLDRWETSRRHALQEIAEALGQRMPERQPPSLGGRLTEQSRARVAEAFRTGRLVALQSTSGQHLLQPNEGPAGRPFPASGQSGNVSRQGGSSSPLAQPSKPITLSQQAFVQQFSTSKQHGVIDLNNLSAELATALQGAGVTQEQLRKLTGPGGQFKGAGFEKLFRFLDTLDSKPGDRKLDLGTKEAPSPVGVLNEAFKAEVARNLLSEQYAAPGSQAGKTQPRLTVETHAWSVPMEQRKASVELAVVGMSQFKYAEDNGLDGNIACFPTAKAQADLYNAKTHGKSAPTFNGPEDSIQVAYAEDAAGRVVVDVTQVRLGREYIDKCLDAGYPALVGLSYADKSYNNDKISDHYVTVFKRGYDAKGRLYYEFKDPGSSGDTGRLHVDKDTGKLFREGDGKTRFVRSVDYEVSQVRTYAGLD